MLRTEIGLVFCVPTFLTMQLGWIAGGDKMETNSQFQLVGPSFVPTPIPKEEKTVTQFLSNTGAKDYYSFVRWNDSLRTLEYLDERKPESSNWIVGKCPICQEHIRGVEVIDSMRQYYNAQVRECYYNDCTFEGNFIAMQHHVLEYHHDQPLEEEEWFIPQ